MSEKFCEALLPPTSGQVINIPKDIQQLTIKDGIIFIGKEHSHRSMSSSCRCLMVVGLLLAFCMGAMIMSPIFRQYTTIVLVGQTGESNRKSLSDRNTTGLEWPSSITTARMTIIEPDATVLFSTMNPAEGLSTYYQVTSVYVARAYKTTLMFFMQNGPSYTYLDDVSVTDSYGRQLLVNGNFENNVSYSSWYSVTSGWTDANIETGSSAHTGQRYHSEGSSAGRNMSQSFVTTPGSVLNISFWIQWRGSGSRISTKVTIFP